MADIVLDDMLQLSRFSDDYEMEFLQIFVQFNYTYM